MFLTLDTETRIAKSNLDLPLVRDTFSMLGSSKCEVLSVIDLKDAFHSLRLTEESKKYCRILSYYISISMLFWNVYRAESIVKLSWMICYYLLQARNFIKASWKIC